MKADITVFDPATVRLSVIDIQGREIAILANGAWPAGRHHATWDGETARGAASTGLYFLRFSTGGREWVQRLAIAH